MLRAAAAATALALVVLAPAAADAGRVRVKPVKTSAQARAEMAAHVPGSQLHDDIKVELGTARGFEKQETAGVVKARGVFTGRSKATGRRKVTHLIEVIDKPTNGQGMWIQSEDIDGDTDEPVVERFFRPVAGASRTAIRHQSDDGLANFLLLIGRGIFDYHGGDFEGDPEQGFGPPTPTPAP